MIRYVLVTLILTILAINEADSQNPFSGELSGLRKSRSEWKPVQHPHYTGLLGFYKHFISSQDLNSCVFSPSCSVYAIRSLKKKGLIEGLFATTDRLCRCHPYETDWYPWNEHRHTWEDPE